MRLHVMCILGFLGCNQNDSGPGIYLFGSGATIGYVGCFWGGGLRYSWSSWRGLVFGVGFRCTPIGPVVNERITTQTIVKLPSHTPQGCE